jgi:hypothetical protein
MLAVDAYECAVLALLGDEAVYMVSQGEAHRALATVKLQGCEGEWTALADTVALAILAATARAILAA